MLDTQTLTRHFESLSDEALSDAVADGPGAYRPEAWGVLERVAHARGLVVDGGVPSPAEPPVSPASGPAWLVRLRGRPPWIAQRIALGTAAVPFLVLQIDALRGRVWFGDPGHRWLPLTMAVAAAVYGLVAPTIDQMRQWDAVKRARSFGRGR